MHTFIEIIKAEYIDGYRLRLYFNTGEVRIADLESSLVGDNRSISLLLFHAATLENSRRRFLKRCRMT